MQMEFKSQTLKRTVSANVILPTERFRGPFPTLYLLHGLTDNYNGWLNYSRIRLWAEESGLAVVMPSGENSFYMDILVKDGCLGDFGEYVGRELVDVTREMFPLSHRREDTFLAGLSIFLFFGCREATKWILILTKKTGFGIKAIFMGTIMTATSVSITVESLKEMGVLNGEIGTTILNAAIIDDVIGMVVLTFVVGLNDPSAKPYTVVRNTLLFFVLAVCIGFICYKIFKVEDNRYPHSRRITIAGLALCLALAFVAEEFFGIADITGAYVAGIILCNIRDSEYIARRLDINSYVLFGPIFFASIGLKTDISDLNMSIFFFAICFVLVGMITKIIGCGLMAMICRIKPKHALKVGVGMMTRGEVALIVSQKGLAVGMMDPVYFTAVILLIIISSITTPILLKLLYTKWPEEAKE